MDQAKFRSLSLLAGLRSQVKVLKIRARFFLCSKPEEKCKFSRKIFHLEFNPG